MKDSAINTFFDEHYRWKAEKEKHREKILRLRKAAHEEFYAKNKGWYKVLDIIGIILIFLNIVALIITGLVVVQVKPDKVFVEANPVQCEWNGWSCHANAWVVIVPVLKQMIIWAVLISLYLFQRRYSFNTTGLLILTAIIILYTVFIGWDTFHDIGLYLGKILYS